MTYEDVILADNPLAFYMLDELTGTTAFDSSGNGYNGTYLNTPTLGAAGLLVGGPTAVSFDRITEESVDLRGLFGTAFFNAAPGWSMEGWIKPTDVADLDQGYFGTWTGTTGGPVWWQHFLDGRLRVLAGVGDANYLDTGFTPVNNAIYHLVATWSTATTLLTAYINGQQRGQRNWPNFSGLDDALYIAGYTETGSFNLQGTAQAVAFYDAPLLASRVSTHYNAGLGIFDASAADNVPHLIGGRGATW